MKGFHFKNNPIFTIFLWLYAVISIYPLIWMVSYSLKNNNEIFFTNPFGLPTHLRTENYVTALKSYNVPMYFANSLFIAIITVIGAIALSAPLAYALARLEWKLKGLARIYITIGMFIPVQVIMVPLAILERNLHISNTYFALIIPYIAFNLSFTTIVFYGFLRGIPFELEESACIDGASIFQAFFRIIAPTIKPAIATMGIFIFLSS